jgi:hypothetical protein
MIEILTEKNKCIMHHFNKNFHTAKIMASVENGCSQISVLGHAEFGTSKICGN